MVEVHGSNRYPLLAKQCSGLATPRELDRMRADRFTSASSFQLVGLVGVNHDPPIKTVLYQLSYRRQFLG